MSVGRGVILFVCGALVLFALPLGSNPPVAEDASENKKTGASANNSPINAGISHVEYVRRHVAFLTGIQPPRNYEHPSSLNLAADYIAGKFRETGAEVSFQAFTTNGQTYRNVIALYPGKSQRRILIGAHYDVAGHSPGADDNASGVAVLLELAFLIKAGRAKQAELPHTVELVAYTLEEPPYFRTKNMGSAIHAKSLKDAGVKLEVMIALDCVGYFSNSKGSQNFPVPGMGLLYPDKGNFLGIIGKFGQGGIVKRVKNLLKPEMELPLETISAPAFISGIDFSDHLNYWKYDYPALLISDTAFYRNHNYHLPGDRPETLDYEKMVQLSRGLHGLVTKWRTGKQR